MAQRNSGYDRVELETYETPAWVTGAVVPHLLALTNVNVADAYKLPIWEPACGSGKMVRALRRVGFRVMGTDIKTGDDFFNWQPSKPPWIAADGHCAIVTNPPYIKPICQRFVEHAHAIMQPRRGLVATLLKPDWNAAPTRAHLFADNRHYARKVVLTRRITWFQTPGVKNHPSEHHAWFIWDFSRTYAHATEHFYVQRKEQS